MILESSTCFIIVVNHLILLYLLLYAVYYEHLKTNKKCLNYQGVLIFQVSLYDKAPFGTITKCVDYTGVPIFKCPD